MASIHPSDSLGIDVETFSEIDVRKVGAHKYARHSSTEVLLIRAILDDGRGNELDRFEWDYGDIFPTQFYKVIKSGVRLRAFNAAFEQQIFEHVLHLKEGWPCVPVEQWYCTAGAALRHALPTSLEKCAAVYNVVHKKLESGTKLIGKFSKPRKDGTRNMPEDFPVEFNEFGIYCMGDVEAEKELYWRLPYREYPEEERLFWLQIQRQNDLGAEIDVDSVKGMIKMIGYNRLRQLNKLRDLTGGLVTSDGQRNRVLDWCDSQGYPLEGYTKDHIKTALKDRDIPDNVKEVLTIRQDQGQTSLAKYPRILTGICEDRTIKGSIMYHRASTGRNGGSGPQFHNLPRDHVTFQPTLIETCLEWVRDGRYEDIELVFGSLTDVAKGMIRPMIRARKGRIFYSGDYTSIENRVTVWVARDPVGLEVFTNGIDQYRAFVAHQFGIELEDVTPEQRTDGKATILGCMFGAGAKTIWKTNVQKGIPMTLKQAKTNVAEFREQYAVTAETWGELDDVCIAAVRIGGNKAVLYKGLKFFCRDEFFFIRLHSGRLLAYHKPRVEQVLTPWGERKWAVTHGGMNSKGAWIRMTLTPSRIIENIVQAEARDLLMFSKLEVEKEGFDVVLDVHDEILAEQKESYMSVEQYGKIMTRLPHWATTGGGAFQDFPLAVEASKFLRYRK